MSRNKIKWGRNELWHCIDWDLEIESVKTGENKMLYTTGYMPFLAEIVTLKLFHTHKWHPYYFAVL